MYQLTISLQYANPNPTLTMGLLWLDKELKAKNIKDDCHTAKEQSGDISKRKNYTWFDKMHASYVNNQQVMGGSLALTLVETKQGVGEFYNFQHY